MTPEAFWKTYDIGLNAQQRAAVEAVEGPVLLLAVPGSGKTTTLVIRLGYLVLVHGIAPEHILTLTYTVSAAADMKERFRKIFGDTLADRMHFRTINGVCALIIASFGRQIGKSTYTLLTDESRTAPLLRKIYQDVVGEYPTEGDLKDVRTAIAYIKNMMLTEDEIRSLDDSYGYPISEIFERYVAQLKDQKCMDYDDQMIYARILLMKVPQLLAQCRRAYQYLCVDEAQDTSRIQHEIIALLAGDTRNLFMVGDEDQSIYGFRAACPEALLHFQDRYPGAQVLLMETNYRSNEKIVAAADGFIQSNRLRHKKNMKAARKPGTDIRFVELRGRGAQYTYLAKAAAEPPRDVTAVLSRDNESLIPLIDLFERQKIPFTLKRSDTSFFTSRVVTDIRNIIAYAQDPTDVSLFLQIYYKLNTYLSKVNAQALCREAERRHASPLDVARKSRSLPESVLRSLKNVRSDLNQLQKDKAVDAMNRILGSLGYGSYLSRSGIRDSKIPILYNLANRTDSAAHLAQRLDELEEFITNRDNPRTNFILSTIHASKGLEYDTVYLIDAADGIFPQDMPEDPRSLQGAELSAYEEERRLFYVGITRARNNLILFEFGKNASLIRQLKRAAGVLPQVTAKPKKKKAQTVPQPEEKPFDREGYIRFVESLSVGDAVVHKEYGNGVIERIEPPRIVIVFDRAGAHNLSLPVVYKWELLTKA